MMIETKKRIKSLPEGRINIKKRNQTVYYYKVVDHKERLLKRTEKKIAEDIIQKKYLKAVYKAAENESVLLKEIQKRYPAVVAEDVFESLSEERKSMVNPIIPTDEQFIKRWLESPYTHKPISDDVPFFKTMNGERVRSKSEVIIADRLSLSGVPYKYECPLVLQIDDELITIHPDFTLLRMSDRKVLYFEHCGMTDDPNYADELVKRINQYSRAGIVLGDRLFLMFETSKTPLDVRVLDNLINSNFK